MKESILKMSHNFRRKICIVLTTRGNYAKMKSTLLRIQENSELELQVILSGALATEGYTQYKLILEKLGIYNIHIVEYLINGASTKGDMLESGALATGAIGKSLMMLSPDIVVVIADRYEALSVAFAATCLNIPIAHLEGGEVSGSIDERIRHAITKLSHLHFVSNTYAARRVFKLGEKKESIYIVGNPSIDLIRNCDTGAVDVLFDYQKDNGEGFVDYNEKYLVVSQHSVVSELTDTARQINETMKVVKSLALPTVWMLPNPDAGCGEIESALFRFAENSNPGNIVFYKSMPFELYALLLSNSLCLIGNSSSGIRECEYLGVPVVNIGSRQNGRERGENVVDVNYDAEKIEEAVRKQIQHGFYQTNYIYGRGDAAENISRILASTEIILNKEIRY